MSRHTDIGSHGIALLYMLSELEILRHLASNAAF